ncbi:MAG: hypothetical protein ACR2JJ_08830 [Sphingomicrobium sp.]
MIRIALLLSLAALASAAPAAPGDKSLFASSDVLQLTIRGPVSGLVRSRSQQPEPATLSVAGTAETLPVMISARGLTRRRPDICPFPPLKVQFTSPPPPQSVFAGQRSLKLVSHCRNSASFQQHVLLEYAAYRMFNALSPASFKVRLASIDYVDERGRPIVSRYAFFIEDLDDVARRNSMQDAKLPERIPTSALSQRHAALYSLFQHMIANHDWSMRAGPAGEECCHNTKLIAPARGVAAGVIPIPYDFDFSGLVNAPYATPPDLLRIRNVRQRQYRGYCVLNNAALAAAVQFQAARPAILAALNQTPGLEERTRSRAAAFLDGFFEEIASPEAVQSKIHNSCID